MRPRTRVIEGWDPEVVRWHDEVLGKPVPPNGHRVLTDAELDAIHGVGRWRWLRGRDAVVVDA